MSLIPWKLDRVLVWDATCVDTLAPSHVRGTAIQSGAAAEAAKKLKINKYKRLGPDYNFVPFGFETLGPWGPSAKIIFKELSKRLSDTTGDRKAGSFLAQRISIAIQRGNAASIFGDNFGNAGDAQSVGKIVDWPMYQDERVTGDVYKSMSSTILCGRSQVAALLVDSTKVAEGELQLPYVTSRDAGVYTCRVSSFTGAKTGATMVITGSKPQFIYYNEKESVIEYNVGGTRDMDCRTHGVTKPEAVLCNAQAFATAFTVSFYPHSTPYDRMKGTRNGGYGANRRGRKVLGDHEPKEEALAAGLAHDNDPQDTARTHARTVKEFLLSQLMSVLDWPANSPDLNPIEHLWCEVKKKVSNRQCGNLRELSDEVKERTPTLKAGNALVTLLALQKLRIGKRSAGRPQTRWTDGLVKVAGSRGCRPREGLWGRSMSNNGRCVLDIKNDFNGNSPLMLTAKLELPKFEVVDGHVNIPRDEYIVLYCPAGFTKPRRKREIMVTCENNKEFDYEGTIYLYSDLKCTTKVEATAVKTKHSCNHGNSELLDIGFNAGKKFVPVYQVCLDGIKTIYSKLNIQPTLANILPNYGFNKGPHSYLNTIFNCNYQNNKITKILGLEFHTSDSCCFEKRQLVSPKDVAPGLSQIAMYSSINVVPHWSTCNSQNWDDVEQRIRTLAVSANHELQVWTGVAQDLQLLDTSSTLRNITFGTGMIEQRVPKYLWKVVQDPASKASLAIIQVNVPDLKLSEAWKYRLCNDVCGDVQWMQNR
ncbi:hypothetical protein MSG28_009234 [Choristoneura fumiferana]|uniref:Uncharacterized protein n=1 Tax=Choristoneura fumiferana TaxID=7141 RepID=A0ACC0KXB5_CHOFU|nr:hypothetical protein MSG28_009234 [Choristoneura fumiferana]